jgi:hypothetical protein
MCNGVDNDCDGGDLIRYDARKNVTMWRKSALKFQIQRPMFKLEL